MRGRIERNDYVTDHIKQRLQVVSNLTQKPWWSDGKDDRCYNTLEIHTFKSKEVDDLRGKSFVKRLKIGLVFH